MHCDDKMRSTVEIKKNACNKEALAIEVALLKNRMDRAERNDRLAVLTLVLAAFSFLALIASLHLEAW